MESLINILDILKQEKPLEESVLLEAGESANAYISEPLPTSPYDGNWNQLYLKYRKADSGSQANYYNIEVSGLKNKTDSNMPDKGYIIYSGEGTGEEKNKGLVKLFKGDSSSVVKPEDIEITEKEDEASLFTSRNADNLINAIKNTKELGTLRARFQVHPASLENSDKVKPDRTILLTYLEQLSKDDRIEEKVEKQINLLLTACDNNGSKPLVGNTLLNALVKYIHDTKKDIDANLIIGLNNILAERVLDSEDEILKNRFDSAILYNPSICKLNDISDLKKSLSVYSQLKKVDYSKVNPSLEHAGISANQIARHILINTNSKYPLVGIIDILKGEINDAETIKNYFTPSLGDDLTDLTLTSPTSVINNVDTITEVGKILGVSTHTKKDFTFFIQLIKENKPEYIKTSTDYDENKDNQVLHFEKVDLDKGTRIKLIYTWNDNFYDDSLNQEDYLKGKLNKIITESSVLSQGFLINKKGELISKINQTINIDIKCNIQKQSTKTIKCEITEIKTSEFTPEESAKEETEVEIANDVEQDNNLTSPTEENNLTRIEIEPDGEPGNDGITRNVSVEKGDQFTGTDGKIYTANETSNSYEIKSGTKILRPQWTKQNIDGKGTDLGKVVMMDDASFKDFTKNLTPSQLQIIRANGMKIGRAGSNK